MRWAISSLVLAFACAHEPPPVVIAVALLPSVQQTAEGTLLGECRIAGKGERHAYGHTATEFDLFASLTAPAASLVISKPEIVSVTWTHFPSRPDARARVEIGGQRHIRFTGYTLLQGRVFSARKRMFAVPGHLWARAGAPVEIVAAEGDVAIARVRTPFAAPIELGVRGSCDEVAYEPGEPEVVKLPKVEARKDLTNLTNARVTLDLYASPDSARPFTTLTLEDAEWLVMDALERRHGFAHVAVDIEDVGFDAWVPDAELTTSVSLSGVGVGGFGGTGCGTSWARRGTVTRDSPLFTGEMPVMLDGAVVEKDADVYYSSSADAAVDGGAVVPFTFVDGDIDAAGDAQMWIAKDAVVAK